MIFIFSTDSKGGYAKDGKIPWLYQVAPDMRLFQFVTYGKTLLAGHNTYPEVFSQCHNSLKRTVVKYDRASYNPEDHRDSVLVGGWKTFLELQDDVSSIFLTVVQHDYKCDKRVDWSLLDFDMQGDSRGPWVKLRDSVSKDGYPIHFFHFT